MSSPGLPLFPPSLAGLFYNMSINTCPFGLQRCLQSVCLCLSPLSHTPSLSVFPPCYIDTVSRVSSPTLYTTTATLQRLSPTLQSLLCCIPPLHPAQKHCLAPICSGFTEAVLGPFLSPSGPSQSDRLAQYQSHYRRCPMELTPARRQTVGREELRQLMAKVLDYPPIASLLAQCTRHYG